MKPEIQVLTVLEAETAKMELTETDKAKRIMLFFRRQEIRTVLTVATLWNSDTPTEGNPQESLDAYLAATLYVAESIKRLMEDALYMGGHGKHFEREYKGRMET